MGIDEEFAAICSWLTARGLKAVTRHGQTFMVYRKEKKYPLEVRGGLLKRKETKQ